MVSVDGTTIEIDGDRLIASLQALREFGATGNGVVRPTFSDVDMAARAWLRDQMVDAGLDAVIDGAGNVFGRSPRPGPALLLGSHSDTQPEGGWLDGAMGVMYAIEVARAVHASDGGPAVDVVAWSDEEGTYRSCLGSASFVGDLTDADLAATNADGETVAEALRRTGLDQLEPVRFEPERHVGYLEAHIEQGPYLEERGQRIGVVTTIVGIRSCVVDFVGEQNHAGTTPMARRKDAVQGLFRFGVAFDDAARAAAGPTTVWTVGDVAAHPGTQSIVPGRAHAVVQWRDGDTDVLDAVQRAVHAAAESAAGELDVTVTMGEAIAPTVMDPALMAGLGRAAERRAPGAWAEMPSAAGHDPMVLSHHLPCAMLFIPSINGISHDFAEDSHHEDIVLGCQVLTDAVADLLS